MHIQFWVLGTPALSILTTVFVLATCDRTLAQNRITPDNSLGRESSRLVRKAGTPNIDRIQGGARRGNLLFHSFQDFGVEQGGEATFANPKGVSNIFTRVTGPLKSNIFGTLGVDGKANLFLLNPNGISFGPQSKLNIAGSFFASTASALDLGDGATFRADTSEVPNLLSIRVPVGVQFGEESGNIVTEGQLQTGRDLTLAGDRLRISGELQAGRDLLLQGNRVLIREGDRPFMGAAGRNFEIEGINKIDIDALGFAESSLSSGGNLVLRSQRPIKSKTRFFSGQDFKIEGVDGTFGSLRSPEGQAIFAGGNVGLESYVGGSLHILAGGNVWLGRVRINETGSDKATINPQNQTKVNGTLTYRDLASFKISGFDLRKNKKSGLARIPTQQTIEIDGQNQATLDVRSGVDWEALEGLPNDSIMSDIVGITDSGITVDGTVRINQPGGQVLLTNRFQPNSELQMGAINTQKIDTSVDGVKLNAGDVSILGRGDIINSLINASSRVASDKSIRLLNSNNIAGRGGKVMISSISGRIENRKIETSSTGNLGLGGDIRISSVAGNIYNQNLRSVSFSGLGNSGQGGDILVSSLSGKIDNHNLRAASSSKYGNSGKGGEIKIFSDSGQVNNYRFQSASSAPNGNSGRGGDILVSSIFGRVNNRNLRSVSSSNGNSGKGGDIKVFSDAGKIDNQGLRSVSLSENGDSSQGGDILVSSVSGNIYNRNLRSVSSAPRGNSGRGGDIRISSDSGKIDNQNIEAAALSMLGNSAQGGNITVSSFSGDIHNQELGTASSSRDGNSGLGGDIRISSDSGKVDNQYLQATSLSRYGNSGQGGNIIVSSGSGRVDNQSLRSASFSRDGNAGRGGSIKVDSMSGNIYNRDLRSASSSSKGQSGQGGDIKITSDSGNIYNKLLRSSSVSVDKNSGQGGDITISSISGDIRLKDDIATFSYSRDGNAGNAGSIVVKAHQGDIIGLKHSSRKLRFLAFSIGDQVSGKGGAIDLMGDLVSNLNLLTLSTSQESGNVRGCLKRSQERLLNH